MEANNTNNNTTTTTATTNNNNNTNTNTNTNNTTNNIKKQTKGRQKIEMKMIQDEEDRLITFSKRRSGIYKKASELVTLCGADVGVVVFSPSGKPFSYGHPSVDLVAKRLLLSQTNIAMTMTPTATARLIDTTSSHPIVEAHRRVRINELNQQYNDLFGHLETEKENRKELQKMPIDEAEEEPEEWWEASIEGMSLDELKQKQKSLEELHANITNHVRERMSTMSTMSLGSFNINNAPSLAIGGSNGFSQRSNPFQYPTEHHGTIRPPPPIAYSHLGYDYGHENGHNKP